MIILIREKMRTRLSANLSVLGTFLMLALSFSFGFHSYTETKKAIITDLNQALQQTILRNSRSWMSRDSIHTYANLSKLFGNPVSIESYNKDFSEALLYTPDRERTGIIIHVLNKGTNTKGMPANTSKKLSDYYIASDTILWASSSLINQDSTIEEIGISFQGYANCSTLAVIGLSDKSLPGIFLGLAFLSAALPFLFKRHGKEWDLSPVHPENIISYGNLNLSRETSVFYKENNEKLKLTPQQYTLMEMFFLSPTHILNRSDICESLWPGKINADETLNTLIRRLRPLVEENSNLRITTDRGRAYVLEIVTSRPDVFARIR